jgi:hypothetical protein
MYDGVGVTVTRKYEVQPGDANAPRLRLEISARKQASLGQAELDILIASPNGEAIAGARRESVAKVAPRRCERYMVMRWMNVKIFNWCIRNQPKEIDAEGNLDIIRKERSHDREIETMNSSAWIFIFVSYNGTLTK